MFFKVEVAKVLVFKVRVAKVHLDVFLMVADQGAVARFLTLLWWFLVPTNMYYDRSLTCVTPCWSSTLPILFSRRSTSIYSATAISSRQTRRRSGPWYNYRFTTLVNDSEHHRYGIPMIMILVVWCDFSAPLLSAARKSDATMLIDWQRDVAGCQCVLIPRSFFSVSQSLFWGFTILASIFIWVQFFYWA